MTKFTTNKKKRKKIGVDFMYLLGQLLKAIFTEYFVNANFLGLY